MPASMSMIAAVEALWRRPQSGPDFLLAAASSFALSELGQAEYGGEKPLRACPPAEISEQAQVHGAQNR